VDQWLKYVEDNHDPERFRLCYDRLEEFVEFVGAELRVRDLRPHHVEDWLKSKTEVKASGTKRNYKAIILACLNWAANKKKGNLIALNPLRGMLELPEGGSRGGEVVWPMAVFDLVLKVANPAFADVVRILAWTGARPSTVCKVEARHFRPKWRLWDVEDFYKHRKTRKKYVKRIRLLPEVRDPSSLALFPRGEKGKPEGKRVWQFHSRSQCMSCHSNQSEYALAFLPEQLNRPGSDGRNQLVTFTEAGYVRRVGSDGKQLPPFDPTSAARERKIADPTDASQPLEARARAYLHANCGHCHSDHGAVRSRCGCIFLSRTPT
jgi:hypothetical protein